jgi:hypothetical protein
MLIDPPPFFISTAFYSMKLDWSMRKPTLSDEDRNQGAKAGRKGSL